MSGKIFVIGGNSGYKWVAVNRAFIFLNCFIFSDLILRRLHGDNIGGIKVIYSISATSEFNLLIIFQVYNYLVFDSSINSHAIFGFDDRHGEHIGYEQRFVVHFKVGEKI